MTTEEWLLPDPLTLVNSNESNAILFSYSVTNFFNLSISSSNCYLDCPELLNYPNCSYNYLLKLFLLISFMIEVDWSIISIYHFNFLNPPEIDKDLETFVLSQSICYWVYHFLQKLTNNLIKCLIHPFIINSDLMLIKQMFYLLFYFFH